MTNSNDHLILDPDGIPILTDLVHDDPPSGDTGRHNESDDASLSADELADALLNSSYFKQQLDNIAKDLTRSVRRQAEQALSPILSEAVTLAFEDSSSASQAAIREQLEKALPELIARSLQDS